MCSLRSDCFLWREARLWVARSKITPGLPLDLPLDVSRISDDAFEFTSQLHLDDDFTHGVFTRPPCSDVAGDRTRNEEDGILGSSGGEQLVLDVAEAGDGVRASLDIRGQL